MPAIPEARYVPESDARLDDWLALMDANEVSHGVLVQVSFLGTDNLHLLEVLDAARGRLRATVQCEPDTPASTLDDWHRRGVRGVRLNTIGARTRPDLSGATWRAFLARLADRGWHLELHDEGEGLATSLAALEGCPARIVVDHQYAGHAGTWASPPTTGALGTTCTGTALPNSELSPQGRAAVAADCTVAVADTT